MDRDYSEVIALQMVPFGDFLASVTVPTINLLAMSESMPLQEVALKIKTLLDTQYGVLPSVIVLACKNWVDAWFGAVVIGREVETSPGASTREAAKSTFAYLIAQMIGIQALLDNWESGEGPEEVVLV